MHTIQRSDYENQTGLELLNQAQGLVEVLGAALTGSIPIEGRIRDGLAELLDLLAVRLDQTEKALTEPY